MSRKVRGSLCPNRATVNTLRVDWGNTGQSGVSGYNEHKLALEIFTREGSGTPRNK